MPPPHAVATEPNGHAAAVSLAIGRPTAACRDEPRSSTPMRRAGPFRYTWLDAVPASITLAQLALTLWIAATWAARSAPELLALFPLSVFLAWYNPIIATHNFLHTPFFRHDGLNRAFAALNSINLGLPQILYRFHHLNHHAHNNDRRGSTGRTRDHGSTYAYGQDGRHEHVVAYCALALLRPGTTQAWKMAQRKGHGRQLAAELLTCAAGLLLIAWWSPLGLVVYWLPVFYVGWFLAHMENYYEHVGADPDDRFANSVSYYGRLYNALLCNEGFHQEHHLRPQAHWTERPQVRVDWAAALDRPGRRIAHVPPLLGFLERRER
jgi:fatty acid desaturase